MSSLVFEGPKCRVAGIKDSQHQPQEQENPIRPANEQAFKMRTTLAFFTLLLAAMGAPAPADSDKDAGSIIAAYSELTKHPIQVRQADKQCNVGFCTPIFQDCIKASGLAPCAAYNSASW